MFPVIVIMAMYMMPLRPDPEYADNMLQETGLDFAQMKIQIEEKCCDDSFIDAAVFAKLKVEKGQEGAIIAKMNEFPQEQAGIILGNVPSWWKPSPNAVRISYYTDRMSASPVILAYIDTQECETHIYIVIIPV